jgi:hypothetical protein
LSEFQILTIPLYASKAYLILESLDQILKCNFARSVAIQKSEGINGVKIGTLCHKLLSLDLYVSLKLKVSV